MARTRHERGAAAIEMAIILPVLILIIGGIVDFGRAFMYQVVLTNGAREGARAAVIGADPVARADAALTGIMAGDLGATTATGACSGSGGPSQVSVTTNATIDFFFLGIIPTIADPFPLDATAVMGCD